LYDLDPHGSGYLPGITAALKALEESAEISLAEREYFSTVGTYLTSAWESAGLAATPTPSQDQIRGLFD
jgi:1-deoxy-D-xylulose 5-phosphate reductoisomerase